MTNPQPDVDWSAIAEGAAAFIALVAVGVSVVFAILARRDARGSAAAAKVSAESSTRSAVAAERAAAISDLEAQRQHERRDVTWTLLHASSDDERGLLELRNDGMTAAHAVIVNVFIDEARDAIAAGTISPGQSVEIDQRYAYGRAVWRADEFNAQGFLSTPDFRFRIRVVWESGLGVPAVTDLRETDAVER